MSHKNILITGGSLQASSRGIAALVLGTIASIQNANPDVSFTGIAGRYNKIQHSNIEIDTGDGKFIKEYLIRGRQIPSLFLKVLLASVLPVRIRKNLFKSDPVIAAYLSADVVVSLSAGDSFSDIYGYRQFLPHYLYDLIAVLLGRPLIIFPQTIGPFKKFFAKLLARFTLSRAKVVFTRESYSTETVKKLCGNRANVIEKVDMAFLMKPAKRDDFSSTQARPQIGLNISGFMTFNPVAKVLIKDFDYIQFMKKVVEIFVNQYGADVFLIPHDYQVEKSNDDLGACETLYEAIEPSDREKVAIVRGQYTSPELKAMIGRYDFFVGARLHACIAGLSMGVATVPVAYSYKFIGNLNKIGLQDDAVCDPSKDSVDCMLEKIQKSYENRALLSQHLKEKLPELQATALSCGKLLNDLI